MSDSLSNNLPDLVGHTIDDGCLLLVDVLGRGGYGVVYLAETTNKIGIQRMHFAVKCIQWDFSNQLGLPQEIDLHRVCCNSSSSVLKIYDVIEDKTENLLFIVMDYCPDGDLMDMIISGRYDGNDELIKNTFPQIIDAVDACHQLNITHRDLKPENILCSDGGEGIVLADFGLASMDQSSKQFNLGSDAYMSPEVRGELPGATSLRYSTRLADIWALGVILVNLTCGRHPWHKASLSDPQFAYYVMHDPDYLLHSLHISYELNEVLKSTFTSDPRQRISILELRERIRMVPYFSVAEVTPVLENSTAHDNDARGHAENVVLAAHNDHANDAKADEVATAGPTSVAIDAPVCGSHTMPVTSTAVEPFLDDEIMNIISMAVASGASSAFVISDTDEDVEGVDSDDESEGPITPEQHAIDGGLAAVHLEDVPDFVERDGLGGGIGPECVFKSLFSDRKALPASNAPMATIIKSQKHLQRAAVMMDCVHEACQRMGEQCTE